MAYNDHDNRNGEKDLETLRREYRNMEVNRKTLAEESSNILRRQQQTLEKLRNENECLKTDVATIQARTTMKPLNSFEQSQLDTVTLEIERYKQLVDSEKKQISNMENAIATLREKIWNQRRKMGGANAATETQRNVEKQVKMLENRLDQAVVKFNRSLANNKKLREDIDNLRGERISFEGVYQKLEKSLQDKKRQMAQVIEQSNTSYETRDKARLEIAAIEQTNKREQENFDRQMEELSRSLELEINAAAERRKNQHPSVTNNVEETKVAAEKAAKAQLLMKEREEMMRERMEKIQYFEDSFRKIEETTGIADVDELIRIFKEADEKNFSVFTFANEQSNEIEDLDSQVQALHASTEMKMEYGSTDPHRTEDVRLNEITSKIDNSKRQSQAFEEKIKSCQSALETIKDSIKMLVTRIGLDIFSEPDHLTINDSNLLYIMGNIEKYANTLLNKYYKCTTRSKSKDSLTKQSSDENDGSISSNKSGSNSSNKSGRRSNPSFVQKSSSQRQSSLHPPKILEYSSDDNSGDEGERPMTLEELKSKTLTKMKQPRKKPEPALTASRRGSLIARRRTSLLMSPIKRGNGGTTCTMTEAVVLK